MYRTPPDGRSSTPRCPCLEPRRLVRCVSLRSVDYTLPQSLPDHMITRWNLKMIDSCSPPACTRYCHCGHSRFDITLFLFSAPANRFHLRYRIHTPAPSAIFFVSLSLPGSLPRQLGLDALLPHILYDTYATLLAQLMLLDQTSLFTRPVLYAGTA